VPSIWTVQVNRVPLARRTWSGQLAVPTRSPGLRRFWVVTSSRSTSAVPTSWVAGGGSGLALPGPAAAGGQQHEQGEDDEAWSHLPCVGRGA